MNRFLLRRLLLLPVILVVLNLAGFTYASLAQRNQSAQSAFGMRQVEEPPLWDQYRVYLEGVFQGDLGSMPVGTNLGVGPFVWNALWPSVGLFILAFLLSLLVGLPLGRAAVRVDPPEVRSWLPLLSTIGLAMPGFYVGTLLVSLLLIQAIQSDSRAILPVAGYGWDLHLVLPVIALAIRPAMQVARVSAGLLSEELSKRYVTSARGFGHTWKTILNRKALKNVLAPLFLAVSSAFRLTVAELVLVEYLFDWPGIGRMLARTLVPPSTVSPSGGLDLTVYFLHPPLLALLLPIFGVVFYLVDTIASSSARQIDPRLGGAGQAEEVVYG